MNKRLINREKGNTKIGKLQTELMFLEKGYYDRHGKEYVAKKTENIEKQIDFLVSIKNQAQDIKNSALIATLKKETATLETQYVKKCIVFGDKEWDRLQAQMKEYKMWRNEHHELTGGCCNREDRKKYDQIMSERLIDAGVVDADEYSYDYYGRRKSAWGILNDRFNKLHQHRVFTHKTKGSYIVECIDNAKKHYNQSIEKLALRIRKKELNESNLKCTTSHVDVNISTTISDGNKTVRAWTIIAEGPIIRPHYRYLIK